MDNKEHSVVDQSLGFETQQALNGTKERLQGVRKKKEVKEEIGSKNTHRKRTTQGETPWGTIRIFRPQKQSTQEGHEPPGPRITNCQKAKMHLTPSKESVATVLSKQSLADSREDSISRNCNQHPIQEKDKGKNAKIEHNKTDYMQSKNRQVHSPRLHPSKPP